jgi:hypothetical protein
VSSGEKDAVPGIFFVNDRPVRSGSVPVMVPLFALDYHPINIP